MSQYWNFAACFAILALVGGCADSGRAGDPLVDEIVGLLDQEPLFFSSEGADFQTDLPFELGIQPEGFSDDLEVLESAYLEYDIEEGDGDVRDYELRSDERGGTLSDAAHASRRDRDKVNLVFRKPDLLVMMDGSVFATVLISLSSEAGDIQALCNGLLVEVAGEAFLLGSGVKCTNQEAFTGFETAAFTLSDRSNSEVFRAFQLMAQNPFLVRVIDLEGTEHSFTFRDPDEIEPARLRESRPQIFLTRAFEAKKYVELGYGY